MTIPFLVDLYGQVLSERKRELLEYYYNEDYSLAEISEITGISRQGIRESVKKSEIELKALDASLHLVERSQLLEEKKSVIQQQIQDILDMETDTVLREKLEKLAAGIDSLSL